MENKTAVIIQARLTSSRFPNKILAKIGNHTLIDYLINRIKICKEVNKIILAIPNNKKNKIISKKIKNNSLIFFGNENDVLDRFYKAAKKYKVDTIVRICGDCPFVDPALIDQALKIFKKNSYDYISNTIKPTFPDGLDVEIFNFDTLKKTWMEAKDTLDREHVTQYIIKNNKFKKKILHLTKIYLF